MVKKVTLIKDPYGAFSKSIDYRYADLLFEVKFTIVSEHLLDASDKFVGAVPKGIIVCPAFDSFDVVKSFESRVVLYNIVCSLHEGVAKHAGAPVAHAGLLGLGNSRFINGWIQSCECR
jgi:hypothetical protein